MKTWIQVQQDILLHEHGDYILGSDRQLFNTVGFWYLRKFSLDHFTLEVSLLQRSTRCHESYLWGRHAFLTTLTGMGKFIPVDAKFQELKDLYPPPPPSSRPPRPQCISEESLRLIDERASLHRNTQNNWNLSCSLTKAARGSLLLDSRKRA